MKTFVQKLDETKKYILKKTKTTGITPRVGIIAGSGLGCIKDGIKNPIVIKYSDIPNFTKSSVSGHAGELILGKLSGVHVAILSGRVHYYEGHSIESAALPTAVLKWLGVETLIVTAATGAINKKYSPGNIVFIKDHINFTGQTPLRGAYLPELGPRFPDISKVYDFNIRQHAIKLAKKFKIKAFEGVYFGVTGPSYETPAEIKAFRKLGGDIVGMSVVGEVIMAGALNLKVLGIAYVSNMAAGIEKGQLKHEDVLDLGAKAVVSVSKIINETLKKLK